MSHKNKNIFDGKKNGFTLIEVVLVLVLVGGVFLALYGIFAKTIVNDKESEYEIIASGLAQEGVEIVRNKRDMNVLAGEPINYELEAGVCYPYFDTPGADPSQDSPACVDGTIRNEKIEQITDTRDRRNCRVSGCLPSKETIYTRECFIEGLAPDGVTVDGAESFAVSCVVSWKGVSGIERKARAMAILTNWR